MSDRRVLTFGHGTAGPDELVDLLQDARVGLVVDVRRYPGSRRHPHVASDRMAQWLPDSGIGYRWEARLGGRRRTDPTEADADPWWKVEAFRAYAAHTRSEEFRAGLESVLGDVAGTRDRLVAVMCSESLWWRCHRRLVSDALVLLHGVDVHHLGHDGRTTPHRPAEGARVVEGALRYDRRDGD